MKQFKIRASACGQIMGVKGLGKTGESYVKQWVLEQIYQRKKLITTKYMQKGNEVEDNSLDFVAEQLGYGMLIKNNEYFENDFITGTPDAILKDLIIDVKNSWDFSTFPLLETQVPNADYYWQAQCYMALTSRKSYKLIYTLMNTPEHLIEKEAYWWCKNNGYDDLEMDIYEDFKARMTYDNIDTKYRIKVFDIAYNESDIEKINERVKECRTLIEKLI